MQSQLLSYASNNKRDVCLTEKIEYEKANMECFGPAGCIKRQPENNGKKPTITATTTE